MVFQPKNYLQLTKKKHSRQSTIWGSIVVLIALIGFISTGSRGNYYTVFAGLFVIPFAIHSSRLLAILKYKDGNPTYAKVLEAMSGNYALFHSCLFQDETKILYIQHSIVTPMGLYLLDCEEERLTSSQQQLKMKFIRKGIKEEKVHFIHIKDLNALEEIVKEIQKETCFSDAQIGNTKEIIEAMMKYIEYLH